MDQPVLKVFTVELKLGTLFGAEGPDGLCALTLPSNSGREFALTLDRRAPGLETLAVEPQETQAGGQLLEYLAGTRRELDAPVHLGGLSDFARARAVSRLR